MSYLTVCHTAIVWRERLVYGAAKASAFTDTLVPNTGVQGPNNIQTPRTRRKGT